MSIGVLWVDWVIVLAVLGLLVWSRWLRYTAKRAGRTRTLTFGDGTTATLENYSARDEKIITRALSEKYGPVLTDREETT